MGVYAQKSYGRGPLRLNLSRSGAGASFGIPGLRLGISPTRGIYVSGGHGGIRYRKYFGSPSSAGSAQRRLSRGTPNASPPPRLAADSSHLAPPPFDQMEVGHFDDLTDALNQPVAPQWPFAFCLGAATLTLVVALLLPAWRTFGLVLAGSLVVAATLDLVLRAKNIHHRHEVLLHYDVELPGMGEALDELSDVFGALASHHCYALAPAHPTLTPFPASVPAAVAPQRSMMVCGSRPPGTQVSADGPLPFLGISTRTLYFLPDRLLVLHQHRYWSLDYTSLQTSLNELPIAESFPHDAAMPVTGTSWRHPTTRGGPDHRYNDNPAVPVVTYAELHLLADHTEFMCLLLPDMDLAARLERALQAITACGPRAADPTPPT